MPQRLSSVTCHSFFSVILTLLNSLSNLGRRSVQMLINRIADFATMNVSCNPFYVMRGEPNRSSCLDGVWVTNLPKCELSSLVCTEPPAESVGPSRLITLRETKLKHEYGEREYLRRDVLIYRSASYTCPRNVSNATNVKSKVLEDRVVFYVDINCVGENRWEEINCG